MSKRFCAIAITFLLANPSAWGVMHLRPGTYPRAAKDRFHVPSRTQLRAMGSMNAAISALSSGNKNVAVILVQFQPTARVGLISGSNVITNLAAIDGYYAEQKKYYSEMSYGAITLNFTFFGVNGVKTTAAASGAYTLAQPEEYYGCGDEGEGCTGVNTPDVGVRANGDYLLRDALVKADVSLTHANYDHVIVMHAGNGNETTSSSPGDIWSIFYLDDASKIVIGNAARGFSEGDVVPATEAGGYSPFGVMCHEFGHSLGLPDLYNTTNGTSVVGEWELMDAGPYDGFGNNPAHMCAWDKMTLGWLQPIVVASHSSVDLANVELNPTAVKLPVQNGGPQEYFLAEYRWRASGAFYDRNIPGDGLLIWHIDDAITAAHGIASTSDMSNTVNSGMPHYGVSIVTADGLTLSNANQGDEKNPFGNGSFFSSPKSNTFSGDPSGINLVNLHGVGTAAAGATAINLQVAASQNIQKLIAYPNPAGKNYPPAGKTTLQFQLTRPANDYALNIYTLDGQLIRKISQGEIALNTDRAANAKWVYEYIWDLTNDAGKMVAPGVYFFTLRADGETARNKLVVIR